MASRVRWLLYSTDLSACTTDEELHWKIAELKAARVTLPSEFDELGDLDMNLVETDEEILAGIDLEPEEDEAVIENLAATAPSIEVTEARSSEVTTHAEAWSKKVTATPAKGPSNKVTKRFRKSLSNDMHTIRKIQEFGKPAPAPNPAPLVAILNPSKPSPLSPPKASPTSSNDNHLPVWEKSDDHLKLTLANEVLETSGTHAVSWTLNLTPAKIAGALSHRSGFAGSLADDLKRALKRELGRAPLFWFHVDISKAGNLHLHGAIDLNTQELDGLERALRHVGGHGPKGVKDDKMVHLNPDLCNEGWVVYASRNRGAVRKAITGPIFTITRPLRLEAADLYGWIRKVVNAA
jgi:hypothetical protein